MKISRNIVHKLFKVLAACEKDHKVVNLTNCQRKSSGEWSSPDVTSKPLRHKRCLFRPRWHGENENYVTIFSYLSIVETDCLAKKPRRALIINKTLNLKNMPTFQPGQLQAFIRTNDKCEDEATKCTMISEA